jgi:hypothetical protein
MVEIGRGSKSETSDFDGDPVTGDPVTLGAAIQAWVY